MDLSFNKSYYGDTEIQEPFQEESYNNYNNNELFESYQEDSVPEKELVPTRKGLRKESSADSTMLLLNIIKYYLNDNNTQQADLLLVEQFLEAGADPNFRDNNDNTPLDMIMLSTYQKAKRAEQAAPLLQLLFQYKADIKKTFLYTSLPEQYFAWHLITLDFLEALMLAKEIMVKHTIDINKSEKSYPSNGFTLFHTALLARNFPAIKFLVEDKKAELKDSNFLKVALENDDPITLFFLLDKGASKLFIETYDQKRAELSAIRLGATNCLKKLIIAGKANIDNYFWTYVNDHLSRDLAAAIFSAGILVNCIPKEVKETLYQQLAPSEKKVIECAQISLEEALLNDKYSDDFTTDDPNKTYAIDISIGQRLDDILAILLSGIPLEKNKVTQIIGLTTCLTNTNIVLTSYKIDDLIPSPVSAKPLLKRLLSSNSTRIPEPAPVPFQEILAKKSFNTKLFKKLIKKQFKKYQKSTNAPKSMLHSVLAAVRTTAPREVYAYRLVREKIERYFNTIDAAITYRNFLIERLKVPVTQEAKRIMTPLIESDFEITLPAKAAHPQTVLVEAILTGDISLIKEIISDKATIDVNRQDILLRTPLHWAALVGSQEIVDILIETGAKPNIKDIFGRFPSHYQLPRLRQQNNDTYTRALMLYKSLMTLEQALFYGARYNDIDCIKDALKKAWEKLANKKISLADFSLIPLSNTRDSGRNTPLHSAAQQGNLDVVEFLIGHNVDTTLVNSQRNTATAVAQVRGHLSIARLIALAEYIQNMIKRSTAATLPAWSEKYTLI